MKPICLTCCRCSGSDSQTMEARARDLADKPLRAIVPVGAGSTTDIIPRVVFEQLSPQLGQSIVVENRTGAGGTIGTAFVAKAEPDGYTILAHGSAHTISPALYPNLSYHPARDFAAVVPLGISPQRPGRFAGEGPQDSWRSRRRRQSQAGCVELLFGRRRDRDPFERGTVPDQRGVDAVHVPFKGGAEAMTEVIAGRVDFFFGPVALVLPHVQRGQARRARGEWRQRAAALPDVPTTLEAGVCRCRVSDLARNVSAGEDAARHRRQAQSRDAQSAARAQSAGQADRHWASIRWS